MKIIPGKKLKSVLAEIICITMGMASFAYGADNIAETDSSETSAEVESELENIAALNNCTVDELIVNYSDNGYVNFLGAAFTDEKIQSPDDAAESLDELVTLAGLEDCEFSFYREDVSPVSGYTYYTFTQVASGIDDDLPIVFSNSQIRIIVDADGNSAGFSADITSPENITPINYDNFVEQTEAEELVKQELDEDSSIMNEMTSLSYWDDERTAFSVSDGKELPAWFIYTNQNSEGRPYTLYVVSAQRDDRDEAVIIDRVAMNSLNVESDTYTSNIFFEGMEDGGSYTYHVDMTWAYEANSGYQAEKELDITVPVMYDPETGLYYLADYNEKIAAANYYDFNKNNEVNAVVSEDPTDINSWHFASMTGPDDEQYFCNADYVISSFDTMLKAYNIYKERYGYNSVDMSGLPILLLMYECDNEYPTNPFEFTVNANNMGQWHDWAVFGTSPTFTGCVEVGTMTHEFAHGINGQLTNAQYLNTMGAVMEGYADSIGETLAYIYGYKDEAYADVVGSEYCSPMRSFSNPYDFKYARYIGGMYYLQPVVSVLAREFDYGGVHSNSSVVNYLSYCLSHNEDSSKAVIDLGKNVDMFVETLYCATYNSGYDELGAYLLFAAENVDLTDDEEQYVRDTIYLLGFAGDGSELDELIAEDGGYTYTITFYGDEIMESLVSYGVDLEDAYGNAYQMGGTYDNESVSMILPDDSEFTAYITAAIPSYDIQVGYFVTEGITADIEKIIPAFCYEVAVGETIDLDGYITMATLYYFEDDEYYLLSGVESQTELTCDQQGIYCLSVCSDDGSTSFIMIIAE